MITVFKNGYELLDAHYIDVDVALTRIKIGASKNVVEKIRILTDEDEISKLKISLPSFVFAGECTKKIEKTYTTGTKKGKKYFSKRENDSVENHSGFFILDFDKINVESKMAQLKQDPYIYSAWVSPSGKGIKALVRCPKDISKHSLYYDSFIKRYPELDTTSRNICRLCFESYDPNIWVRKDSRIWDKVFTQEHKKSNDNQRRENRNNKIISTAVGMIRASVDGEKHDTLLKASKLLGGYISIGRVDEAHAKQVLLDEVNIKGVKDIAGAEKTIEDGIDYGKRQPIQETKKIEKAQNFIKRDDGSYDFIADTAEMDEYENALLDGTLEMGLPLHVENIDKHWMIKKNHLVAFGGVDNIGKSFNAWYVAVLSAMYHGWKFLIYSAENKDSMVRKKLKEFYIGCEIKQMTSKQRDAARIFFDNHFKIMTSKKFYTWDDLLLRAEIVFDEGWEYDCVIIDPYNAMDVPTDQSGHIHNIKTLNTLRVFKENYCSVWFCDHAVSAAAREKDNDGYVKVPYKSSLDGGQIKANKVDDFVMLHRRTNHPEEWMITEWHIMKIKDVETGGKPTPKDDPIKMSMNRNMCGFTFDGYLDPVRRFWADKKIDDMGVQMTLTPNENFETNEESEEPPF